MYSKQSMVMIGIKKWSPDVITTTHFNDTDSTVVKKTREMIIIKMISPDSISYAFQKIDLTHTNL